MDEDTLRACDLVWDELGGIAPHDDDAFDATYSPASAITHRLNVRRFARQKRAALAAHRSEVNGDGRIASVMRVLVRLPVPLFGLLLGREWFSEVSMSTIAGRTCTKQEGIDHDA